MKINKEKVLKILFFISFLPFIFLLAKSTYHAIFGYDEFTWVGYYVGTIYGFEAFLEVFVWTGLALCFIPVLPICFVYQLIYIIRCFARKKHNEYSVNAETDVN